jgi:hypothetical protein
MYLITRDTSKNQINHGLLDHIDYSYGTGELMENGMYSILRTKWSCYYFSKNTTYLITRDTSKNRINHGLLDHIDYSYGTGGLMEKKDKGFSNFEGLHCRSLKRRVMLLRYSQTPGAPSKTYKSS